MTLFFASRGVRRGSSFSICSITIFYSFLAAQTEPELPVIYSHVKIPAAVSQITFDPAKNLKGCAEMAFGNPFAGNVERKMTKEELIQAIRFDLSGELEAIYGYEAHYLATDDPLAKEVLKDIRDEEKAHIGELMTLLRYLDPKEQEKFDGGVEEVHEEMEKMGLK